MSVKVDNSASSGKVQRWALYIQQFDVKVVHIEGRHNMLADWMSHSVGDTDGTRKSRPSGFQSSPWNQYRPPEVAPTCRENSSSKKATPR